MISTFANISLTATFLVAACSCLAYFIGARFKIYNFILSGNRALYTVFCGNLVTYSFLSYGFLANDFSLNFVYKNSSTDLPLFYKITGPWSGLEGSLLLWALLLSFFCVFIPNLASNKERPIQTAYVVMVLMFIELFLLSILIFATNPTAPLLPVPAEGRGMNPLLQDPGMVLHPPLLYLGFIGISVPFAYSLSALFVGRIDNSWILLTRRWTLMAWLFLTTGMIVGGMWAYHVLGWGGYWAWDPVENSSLMPWLATTTFLHSSMVQEKTKGLKVWNVSLIILAFGLTILGTFITRSGVLNSVHAFSNSSLGGLFLAFLTISLLGSFGLLIYRMDSIDSPYKTDSWINKENMFLVNNLLFLAVLFTVFYGTVFPLLAEAFDARKISIQAPYFNSINLPFAVLILILMAMTPFLSWRRAKLTHIYRLLYIPLALAVVVSVFGYLFLTADYIFSFLLGLVYFVMHMVLLEIFKLTKIKKSFSTEEQTTLPLATKTKSRSKILQRKIGAMVVHLSMVLLFLSFLGKYLTEEQHLNLPPNEWLQLGPYQLIYREQGFQQRYNVMHQEARIDLYKGEQLVQTLTPAKAFYPTSNEAISVVSIYRNPFEDVYVSLASFNEDGSVGLNLYLNRWVLLIPFSLVLLIVGVLLCLRYKSPTD